jgi:superoxide dismutase, Fe-Mn family
VAKYTLPELPYDYAALEPYISGQIMELHHDKHHQAYVTGANGALDQLAEARAADQFGSVNMLEKNLAFNLAGQLGRRHPALHRGPHGYPGADHPVSRRRRAAASSSWVTRTAEPGPHTRAAWIAE